MGESIAVASMNNGAFITDLFVLEALTVFSTWARQVTKPLNPATERDGRDVEDTLVLRATADLTYLQVSPASG